ncbi:MAG: A/G-specific adenine glycosylase [Sphingobacteriaceae bacterium]|nr:A/G-specific adenine glycosylase [Sphingobacteriaceae bacterium]
MEFQKELINWYLKNKRDLPWRNQKDAYVIWLSEIILQQTRVAQGLPYFEKFLAHFPTVVHFSSASEQEVLKLWQGLGYYSRGRNMLHTAKMVVEKHQGIFPIAYKDLILLKGIGDYTAAAISSFSNGEQKAVLDGNVFRVLARYFGISTAINSSLGKKEFSKLAQELILGQDAANYNQAIMEFGALQCKPVSPNCGQCVLATSCAAFSNQEVTNLPVKIKKAKSRERWFNYFFIENEGDILVHHRQKGDVWQHLYDFPLVETTNFWNVDGSDFNKKAAGLVGEKAILKPLHSVKHLLTHQTIYVQFFEVKDVQDKSNSFLKISLDAFKLLPQPKVIHDFMSNYEKQTIDYVRY